MLERYVREFGVRFACLDHLKLIKSKERDPVKAQAERMGGLSALAEEFDIPIFLSAQINRDGARAESPALHHLEGSASIEQDSETVILLDAKPPDTGEDRGDLIAVLAKSRDGKPCRERLWWEPEYYRIDQSYYDGMQEELPHA